MHDLKAPFTEKEIKIAVFQIAAQKSQGPDGFSFAFYKHYWDIIKMDLLRVFQNFYDHHVDKLLLHNLYSEEGDEMLNEGPRTY